MATTAPRMTISGLGSSPELRLRLCSVIGLFLLWMTLNIGLNLGVNYAMKPKPRGLGFNFPLAFTMCHMYFSMAGCSLVMALVPRMRQLRPNEQLNRYGLPLMCLSFFYVMAISANNVSLINLSLSVNQIIKSCAPLPVIALAYMLQGKVVPWPKLLSVLLLVSGAVMAVPYGHPHITARGLSLAVLSTVSVGVKAVLSSILLDKSEESGLIPVVVAWYDACISGGLLFLACLFTDDIHLMFQYFSSPDQPWEAVPVFVALGTVAFFYNFVALAFIQATSALAIMVAGNLKHVLLIVLPMVMHHESDPNRSYSAYHWLGVSLFFLSLACYTGYDVYLAYHPPPKTAAAAGGDAAAPSRSAAGAAAPNERTPLTKGSGAPAASAQPSAPDAGRSIWPFKQKPTTEVSPA